MVQYEIGEQLKYLMLTFLILGISICVTNFYVFGELSSADKQEIKKLLDNTITQFWEHLLDKKSTVITGTLEDPYNDYNILPVGLNESKYQYELQPVDIRHIDYQFNDNSFNSTVQVAFLPSTNFGTFDYNKSSPTVAMYVTQVPPKETYSVQLQWNIDTQRWERKIFDFKSTSNVGNAKNVSYIEPPGDNFIPLNTKLADLGIGGQYRIKFVVDNVHTINGTERHLIDYSNEILVPPPRYNISAPQSLDLKPGQETFVKIGVNSQASYNSTVSVWSPSNSYVTSEYLTPKQVIPKQSTGYFTLRLNASENAIPGNFNLPIIAHVSFPDAFPNTTEAKYSPLKTLEVNSGIAISILPKESASLSIPPEVLATIYTIIISTIIGWSIPNIASYISSRRRRRNFLKYITTIDKKYDTQKDNINALKDWLSTFERKMQYALGNGEISESQYDLLKKKIDNYSNDNVKTE